MTTTSPWVSIFSRFTSEALLFEALIIFSLAALYTGFWLVRKRKFGVIEKQVPAGVVKYYLNELIVDAEELRAQLFGMLTGHGVPATPLTNVNFSGVSAGTSTTITTGVSTDAGSASLNAGGSLGTLEAKLAEQAKQIESFTAEKARIERELLEAKAATQGGATPSNNGDAAAMAKLHEKIAVLEGKLAEYSVIEDDLANLKRLQQENAALKAQLAAKGGSLPAAATTTAATPSAHATAANAAKTADNAAAKDPMAAVDDLLTNIAPAEAATSATPNVDEEIAAAASIAAQTPGAPDLADPLASAEAGTLEGGFEGLVDQVEQSLQPTETTEIAAAATAAATAASTKAPPAATIEKSDADLVSEFEKMLNG